MTTNDITTNSWRAWWLAARPKTLSGAAMPVMVGLASAASEGHFLPVPALLCVLFALLMQIDANFINDYFDFCNGTDDAQRLGPQRACQEGWVTLPAMRRAILITTLLACAAGCPLIAYGGWNMIWVGMACVLFCFLYTTCLARMGLGDLLVLVFFGLIPVCTTYYLQSHSLTAAVVCYAVACGLVVDGLLIVNNYRDYENDKRVGKITFVVKIGKNHTEKLYLWLGIAAVACCQAAWLEGKAWAALLPAFFLVFHLRTWKQMKAIGQGKELNVTLGETARNILVFGALLAFGLLL